jgi:hypothetical protein
MQDDIHSSSRFDTPAERRDFLGLAAIGSTAAALGVAGIGAARLPMPSVFPEANARVKLGPLAQFAGAPVTPVPEHRLWILSDEQGLYAISAVCTIWVASCKAKAMRIFLSLPRQPVRL